MKAQALLIICMLLLHTLLGQQSHTITIQVRINIENGKPAEGINWTANGYEVVTQRYNKGSYELSIKDATIGQVVVLDPVKKGYVVINPAMLTVSLLKRPYQRPSVILLCKPEELERWSRFNAQREVVQHFPGLRGYPSIFSPGFRKSAGRKPSDGPELQKLVKKTKAWHKGNVDAAHEGRRLKDNWLQFAASFLFELNIDSSLYCYREAAAIDSTNRGLISDLIVFEFLNGDQKSCPARLAQTLAFPMKNDDDSLLHALLLLQQAMYNQNVDSAWLRDHPAPIHRWQVSDSALLARYCLFYGMALVHQEDEAYNSWLQQGLSLCMESNLSFHVLLYMVAIPDAILDIGSKEHLEDSVFAESISYLKYQYQLQPNYLHTLAYYLMWFDYAERVDMKNIQEYHEAMGSLIEAIKENPNTFHTDIFESYVGDYTGSAFPDYRSALSWLKSRISEAEALQNKKQADYSMYLAYLFDSESEVLHDSIIRRKSSATPITVTEQQALSTDLANAEIKSLDFLVPAALIDTAKALELRNKMTHVESCIIKDSLKSAIKNIVKKLPAQTSNFTEKKIYAHLVNSLLRADILDTAIANKLVYRAYPFYKELYNSKRLTVDEITSYLIFLMLAEKITNRPKDKVLQNNIVKEKYEVFKRRSESFPAKGDYASQFALNGAWPYLEEHLVKGEGKVAEHKVDNLLNGYLQLASKDSAYYTIAEAICSTTALYLLKEQFLKDTTVLRRWALKYEQIRQKHAFYRNNANNEYYKLLDKLSDMMEDTLLVVLKHTMHTDSLSSTMHTLIGFVKDYYLPLRKEHQNAYNKTEIVYLQLRLADYLAIQAGYELQQQNLSLAANATDTSLAYEPEHPKALVKKGHWYLYTGRCEEALKVYRLLKDKTVLRRTFEFDFDGSFLDNTTISCYAYIKADLANLKKLGFTHKYEKEIEAALAAPNN